MTDLAEMKCVPCHGGVAALKHAEIIPLVRQLKGWDVVDDHHLSKEITFPDFVTALAFVNEVGGLAEKEGHHPDISLSWGKVGIQLWTHAVGGLSQSDFVLAAKIDKLPHV
jgi:4a-hydroxytetrahydrobiopterin dehydratase